MTLAEIIRPFLGQQSEWRLTKITAHRLCELVGGEVTNLRFRHAGRDYGMHYQAVSAGVQVPGGALSNWEMPQFVRSLNQRIYRRPALGRELHYDDFLGGIRAINVGGVTLLAFGSVATIVSTVLTGAVVPPAMAAGAVVQLWGSVAIAFQVEDTTDGEATTSLGVVKARPLCR